ncbi:MAG: HisA/HisF-related TIM barrel protein [Senegalimassilia faecalis]
MACKPASTCKRTWTWPRRSGIPVIASGGVASVADIQRLAPVAASVEGVITGRAVYEGTLDVAEGVRMCAGLTAAEGGTAC